VRRLALLACAALCSAPVWAGQGSWSPSELKRQERSYWLHATLSTRSIRGYWAPATPLGPVPSEQEVRDAARLLSGHYGANRLYLMYHREVLPADAIQVFGWWRRHLPADVEIIPTFVLVGYDRARTPVFGPIELRSICRSMKQAVNASRAAVYDVEPLRDASPLLDVMRQEYLDGLLRVGIQPSEKLGPPFAGAVQDTWSGMCHGRTNEDWLSPGFGADTLKQWVTQRNGSALPVAWDLVAVAWDYLPTERGEYPGYDDAAKNMPLPDGRNALAARLMMQAARRELFAGFSSDLFIVEANSKHPAQDGPDASFYECLRRGQVYRGRYARPLEETAGLYRALRAGRAP